MPGGLVVIFECGCQAAQFGVQCGIVGFDPQGCPQRIGRIGRSLLCQEGAGQVLIGHREAGPAFNGPAIRGFRVAVAPLVERQAAQRVPGFRQGRIQLDGPLEVDPGLIELPQLAMGCTELGVEAG